MNYYQFSPEDFAADDFFKEWVCSPTPETETFWNDFLQEYPERYYQVEEARKLVSGLQLIQQLPQVDNQVDAIWNRLENSIEQRSSFVITRWFNRVGGWQLAAGLLLVSGLGWLVYQAKLKNDYSSNPQIVLDNEWVERLNEANQVMQIQMADGSIVELTKGSRLRYKKELTGTLREVYLTGEAFFVVQKNPHRPFVVYANGLVTRVLGTSFRVKAPVNSTTVTVDVKTGRVSVYPNESNQIADPESRGLVLTPNQQAIFELDKETLNKTLVASPSVILSPEETRQFNFDNASAAQVFEAIEKAYGVDIIFDEEVMQHCTLTLSIDNENLFEKLEVICKLLDASYKLIDAQVVIYSKGCLKPTR